MSELRQASSSLARKAGQAYRATAAFLKRVAVWLSPPPRLCATLLAAAFLVSLLSWSIGDRVRESVLFFPQARTGALRGELRNLPRTAGKERLAELLASELLLGPADPALLPAFPAGVKVVSTLYRRGCLYIDLSEDAALAEEAALRTGLLAMERSLRAGMPGTGRIVITIGGIQPFVDGLPVQPAKAKKE